MGDVLDCFCAGVLYWIRAVIRGAAVTARERRMQHSRSISRALRAVQLRGNTPAKYTGCRGLLARAADLIDKLAADLAAARRRARLRKSE